MKYFFKKGGKKGGAGEGKTGGGRKRRGNEGAGWDLPGKVLRRLDLLVLLLHLA